MDLKQESRGRASAFLMSVMLVRSGGVLGETERLPRNDCEGLAGVEAD